MVNDTATRTEYGLALPNGQVAWNDFRGHLVHTAEQRWLLLQIVRQTAIEIGFDEREFLSRYAWVSRTVTVDNSQSYPVDSDEMCSAPSQSDTAG